MIEQLLSIVASSVVFVMVALRLNALHAKRAHINAWRIVEVLSLAGLMGGCMGVIGEWFLTNAEFHAETIVMTCAAAWAMSRLEGWDGEERRSLTAYEFLEHRFRQRH